ncbi:hypothetical protein ACMFMG_006184 [Clarireedia jacksonii]
MALCEQCSKLDLSGYRFRRQDWRTVSMSGDQSRTARDIIQLRDSCQLCSVFASSIERNHVGLNASIRIHLGYFCSSEDNREMETFRLKVDEMIDTSKRLCGPLEADQMVDLVDNRCILELQECCSAVPSTADECPQVQRCLSRDMDRRFSGRFITPKANPKVFSKWVKLCSTLHGESCGEPIFPAKFTQGLKSLLMIDVQNMCIVDAPTQCRYVTLSYCWGNVTVLKHSTKNSTALRQYGALSTLNVPATIADAIELIREMGERYLWVDALCIIQDDPVSQKVQLSQMGLIYSLAAFTVVAASGSYANVGLPGVRAYTRNVDQKIVRVGNQVLLTVVDGDDYYGGIKTSAWATRAWTMQEKVLSKKLLIFTDQQIYWSCWNATWLEEVALEEVFNINFQRDPLSLGPEDEGFHSIAESRDTLTLYRKLVNQYRHRQLTFDSDILNAFSGICQALGAIADDSYHWGLPVSCFGASLTWCLRGGGARNYALCDPHGLNPSNPSVPFPSWSWAAWHGTSRKSWIDWSSHVKPEESYPEIMFFASNTEGQLKEIKQRENRSTSPRAWKGRSQTIHDGQYTRPINPGHLHFWTSTAILSIRRRQHSSGGYTRMRHTILATNAVVYMDTWDHAGRINGARSEDPVNDDIERLQGNDTDEIVEREFVVVAVCGSMLSALAVEWKEGVAYRIGCTTIEESLWIELSTLVWKYIILS